MGSTWGVTAGTLEWEVSCVQVLHPYTQDEVPTSAGPPSPYHN